MHPSNEHIIHARSASEAAHLIGGWSQPNPMQPAAPPAHPPLLAIGIGVGAGLLALIGIGVIAKAAFDEAKAPAPQPQAKAPAPAPAPRPVASAPKPVAKAPARAPYRAPAAAPKAEEPAAAPAPANPGAGFHMAESNPNAAPPEPAPGDSGINPIDVLGVLTNPGGALLGALGSAFGGPNPDDIAKS